MTKKQPSDVNSQPAQSSFQEQQIITDIQQSNQPSREDDKLPSIDSNLESIQSVITDDEQQQQIISSPLSNTSETIDRTTSINRQPSVEIQSTKETNEELPSDSLVDIVRQIRTIPPIIRLPSTENNIDTTHIVEQEIEKSFVEPRVKIVQENESIPNEPVTAHEERVLQTTDIKNVPSETSNISFVAETKQQTTPEDTRKEDEAERLSSDHVRTEDTVSIQKQDETSSTDSFDDNITKQYSRAHQENVHEDIE
jgi:hypothetical protein